MDAPVSMQQLKASCLDVLLCWARNPGSEANLQRELTDLLSELRRFGAQVEAGDGAAPAKGDLSAIPAWEKLKTRFGKLRKHDLIDILERCPGVKLTRGQKRETKWEIVQRIDRDWAQIEPALEHITYATKEDLSELQENAEE
jgi:hypothetical protein